MLFVQNSNMEKIKMGNFWEKEEIDKEANIVDKELFELLERKFVINKNPKEKEFLNEIERWINYHAEQANLHKKKYFSSNMKISKWKSIEIGGEKVGKLINVGISIIGITVIVKVITNIWNTGIGETGKIIVSFLLIVALASYFTVFFSKETKQREARLRQYGETWIRHIGTWWELKQELIMYLYELGKYTQKTESMQKQLFMERMVEIENADMKQFEKNMEDIQEII